MSSGFEIEAMLDEAAKEADAKQASGYSRTSNYRGNDGDDRRARDKDRRDRSPDRHRGDHYASGDRYVRARSPDDRYYRPDGRRDRHRGGRDRDRARSRSPARRPREHGRNHNRRGSGTPPKTEEERDRCTVFVAQISLQARNSDLRNFFSSAGKIVSAQIITDKVSQRSKGIGYVEFHDEASAQNALKLTGRQLFDQAVIVLESHGEKNRQAAARPNSREGGQAPFHRLYVGNIHFSITKAELENVFNSFGPVQMLNLEQDEKDPSRSKGHAQVQYYDPDHALEAIQTLNGFSLANRSIRVGLGNSRFNDQTTKLALQQWDQKAAAYKASRGSTSSNGRRQDGGGNSNFDRPGGRGDAKEARNTSALDDTDIMGIGYNNYSRDTLMRKLAREEPVDKNGALIKPQAPKQVETKLSVSRAIRISNVFNAEEEAARDPNWVKGLTAEVKEECEAKYGKVLEVAVDANSEGDIYVRFEKVEGGERALQGLNGRFFGGRVITASPVPEGVFSTVFGRRKA